MLTGILDVQLLVARMHAEPDASELPPPASAGFVIVVTVRVCRHANSLME